MTLAPTTATPIAPAPSFALVPFHQHQVLAARVGEQIRVPMKPFCETIGLPWEPQRKRIARDPVLNEGASMMEVPSPGGSQLGLVLPIELLVGFLFTAESRRYAPELRGTVDLFRRECFAVLHAHFFPNRSTGPTPVVARAPATPAWQELDAARRAAPALVGAISIETRPAVRRYLHALLAHDADRLGLPVPALDELGREDLGPDDLVARLVDGLETLTARRVKWNHLGQRTNGRMAILLPELARLFARADIDVPIDDALRAALRSGRRWHIVRRTIPSAIARKPVLATILAPSPFGVLG